MNGLGRRVSELEKASPAAEPTEIWALIAILPGETEEQAKARYIAEHPDKPTPTNWIELVGVAPKHGGTE